MKSLMWTLTLLSAGTFSATAFADHQYGSPYSLGPGYSVEQGYHDQLNHNAFHRQQAHEQFHDRSNHQNFDRQLYRGGSYGGSFGTMPYGGFNSWNSYSQPTYRTPGYTGYGSSWQFGGYGSSSYPRW